MELWKPSSLIKGEFVVSGVSLCPKIDCRLFFFLFFLAEQARKFSQHWESWIHYSKNTNGDHLKHAIESKFILNHLIKNSFELQPQKHVHSNDPNTYAKSMRCNKALPWRRSTILCRQFLFAWSTLQFYQICQTFIGVAPKAFYTSLTCFRAPISLWWCWAKKLRYAFQ